MDNKFYYKKMLSFGRFQAKVNLSQFLSSFIIIAVNIVIAGLIRIFAGDGEGGFTADSILLIYGFVLGIVIHAISFKFAIMNGLTRKMYFFVTLIVVAVASVLWATVSVLLALTPNHILGVQNLYHMIYGQTSFATWVWEIAAQFLLIMLGWLIAVAFARTNKMQKLIMMVALMLIVPLYGMINIATKGAALNGLVKVLMGIIGLVNGGAYPYMAAGIFVAIAGLCAGGIFLLVRRASAA